MSVLNSFRRIITPAATSPEQQTPATPPRARAPAQQSPLFAPSPPTSPSSLRRQRSQNFDRQDSLALGFSPPAQKRHKTFAREVCRDQALPLDALDDFASASLIVHKKQSRYAELVAILDTKDFETRLKSRLTALLLSPNITAYVIGTAVRVMELIVENPEAFTVPPDVFDHSELHVKLSTVVSTQLAQARGNIKQKLTLSLGRPGTGKSRRVATSNISTLCNSLAPRSSHMELRTVHWTRVAFLRATLVDFNQLNFGKKPDVPSADREPERRDAGGAAEGTAQHETDDDGNGQQPQDGSVEGRQPAGGSDQVRHPEGATSGGQESEGESGESRDSEGGTAGTGGAGEEGEHGEHEQHGDDGADADEEEVYNSNQYWTYVDDQMTKLRALLRKQYKNDEAAQVHAWTSAMADLLQKDMRTYKGKGTIPNQPPSSGSPYAWQTFMEKASVW